MNAAPLDTASPELTARGRASRDRLVQAALGLMLEKGVAAASIDEILDRAGASKSQMYHYFTSKRDLIDAVIAEATRTVLDGQAPFLGAIDGWAALEAWADHVVEVNRRSGPDLGCPLGTLAAELCAADPHCRDQIERAFATWRRPILEGLRTMRERGELSATADPDRLSMAVIASLQGGLLMAKTTHSIEPIRVALDSALGFVRSSMID
jgi:AcrR family transcriptional regulator